MARAHVIDGPFTETKELIGGLLALAGEVDRGSGRVDPALAFHERERGGRDPPGVRGRGLRREPDTGAPRAGGASARGSPRRTELTGNATEFHASCIPVRISISRATAAKPSGSTAEVARRPDRVHDELRRISRGGAHSRRGMRDQIIHARLDLGASSSCWVATRHRDRYHAPQGFNVMVAVEPTRGSRARFQGAGRRRHGDHAVPGDLLGGSASACAPIASAFRGW